MIDSLILPEQHSAFILNVIRCRFLTLLFYDALVCLCSSISNQPTRKAPLINICELNLIATVIWSLVLSCLYVCQIIPKRFAYELLNIIVIPGGGVAS